MNMSKPVSIISALLCTFIWGTTFIAQETGMEKIGPYTFNAVRFFVGFIALIPLYLICLLYTSPSPRDRG